MTDFVIPYHAEYGAVELKMNSQKFTTLGFIVAALLHFMAIGTYWASIYLAAEEEPKVMRILRYSELGPPPSLASSAPAVAVSAPAVKPSVGIPVPVPDAEISPEQTIATQQEMSAVESAIGEGSGSGEIRIEDEGPPPDFVPFEKEPVAIKKPAPVYPEIARRAGVEGTVWLKVWVDKEGKVRKAEILKSDADIFNQPAIDAATQWVFTPALMKNGPVSVWVSIPFRFKLQGN